MTYRAMYYTTPDGQSETVLTGPEHAELRGDDLQTVAIEEAYRADLIGDESPRISLADLIDGLRLGNWTA